METTSRKTQCPVSKILQRYIKELKLEALLVFDKINFFNKANLFSLSRKPFVALRAWAINRWKKSRSAIYSTDQKLG